MINEYLYKADPFIIAETAYTFEGEKDYLFKQTENIPDAVDAIKYHMLFDVDNYMVNEHSLYTLLNSWILSEEEWKDILTEAKRKRKDVIILADDVASVDFLEKNPNLVDAMEIHAACVNDLNLLDRVVKFTRNYEKTFIIGISGFEIQELFLIIETLKAKKVKDILLMYGFQNYPTDIEKINLKKLQLLKKMFDLPIGYADHCGSNEEYKDYIIAMSYSMGANIQEIHYVLQEGTEKTDAITAISNRRFIKIKKILNELYQALGSYDLRLNEGEQIYLDFRKVPIYAKNLRKGHCLQEIDIKYKRVEHPIQKHTFLDIKQYLGQALNSDVSYNTEVLSDDFN